MGIGSKLKSKAKQFNKSFVGTFDKDLNGLQIPNKLSGAAEFLGITQNDIDQRINDGLSDLLSGTLGVRTSNVPAIKDAIATKEAARAERIKAVTDNPTARAGQVPPNSLVLQFPQQYFNERGSSLGDNSTVGKARSDADRKYSAESIAATAKFPNSMHFRSLKRKKQGHEEFAKTDKWYTTEAGTKMRNQDVGDHGSVDPSKEPVYDIFLYLPPQLADSLKVSYTEGEAGMMEAFFAKLFTTGDEDTAVRDITGGNNVDANELMKMFKSVVPGAKLIQQAAGNMMNPMKFQTLENVAFRTYTYKFTLKPTTKAEAQEIKQIIHAFRISMLPGAAGENDRIWTLPNQWAIKFQGPIAKWVDYPLACWCTGCDVDYAGGGSVVMMEDGAPASIDLTVEFTESTQLNRQKYTEQVSAQTRTSQDGGRSWAEKGTVINTNPVTNPGNSSRTNVIPVEGE